MKKMQIHKIENYMNKDSFDKIINILNNTIESKKVLVKVLIPNVYKLSSE